MWHWWQQMANLAHFQNRYHYAVTSLPVCGNTTTNMRWRHYHYAVGILPLCGGKSEWLKYIRFVHQQDSRKLHFKGRLKEFDYWTIWRFTIWRLDDLKKSGNWGMCGFCFFPASFQEIMFSIFLFLLQKGKFLIKTMVVWKFFVKFASWWGRNRKKLLPHPILLLLLLHK